jgi:arylsulfatase A-like enzyme
MGKGADNIMKPPNVITIMVDQLKATALNLYGNTWCDTPNLRRLADEGVLFQHAFTPHPLCVPARISMWTSQYSHTHGSRRNETFMPDEAIHAFKLWKAAGYHTGLIGKNHCFHTQADYDRFDIWCEIEHNGIPAGSRTKGMDWITPVESVHEAHAVRRNMPKLSPRILCAVTDYPEAAYSTSLVCRQTIRFLENHKDDPFALWVSLPDPHDPYEVPRRYADMFPKEQIQLPPWWDHHMDDAPERNQILREILGLEQDAIQDVYQVLGIYYGMIRFLDDEIGHLLDALDQLGLKDNTIVVFCSDHGDFAGEHGMMGKGGLFYDCLTRVPLIMSWPGHIGAGLVDHSMVNLIDIVPTLLHLQGVDIPPSMQGKPLPTVTDALPRDAVFSEYGAGGPPFTLDDLAALPKPYGRHTIKATLQWREAEGRRKMVRTREWKYIHDPMGDKDELYDLVNDPWEIRNVIHDPDCGAVIAELQGRLLDWSIATEDAKPVPLV